MDRLAILGGTPARNSPIYYGKQYIDESDISAVKNVLKSDFLTCGPEIDKLEKKLCDLTNASYAVAIANATAALHAACFAAGIGPGDEVITTPITFAASANGILYNGGTPVFADIEPETYNISPKDIIRKITPKTKAIIAVDFTGQSVNHDELRKICDEHGLILIEDAAHAIGTKYRDKYVGNIADMTIFSFHPVKTITGGEGGAILTNNIEFDKKLRLFRSHGITRNPNLISRKNPEPWYYEQIDLGYNYRITDFQAALISSQLDKLNSFIKRRQEIVEKYNEAFSQVSEIFIQQEIPESHTSRHLYIIKLNLEALSANRLEIFNALKAENIICNVHYIPVYYFPYYKSLGYCKGLCPNAEELYERIITIPLYYSMSNEDVNDVILAVKKVIDYYKI